jgi:glutamate-5-semialdehyde dehydrogenase
MAVPLIIDAKTQYVAACNAAETLLVHRKVEKELMERLREAASDQITFITPASEADFREYLDYKLTVKVVDSLDEAIAHINRHGSHHTDAILAQDPAAQQRFLAGVDSAGVYVNCSTRFADGYRYGFGAEVGIATGKLHARGPVGLEGLCTYKYVLLGSGQTVAETADGTIRYTHRDL